MNTVQFINVGRNKLNWTVQLKATDEQSIAKAVKAKGALMSRDVWCGDGKVYAGFHSVGEYLVLGEQTSLDT